MLSITELSNPKTVDIDIKNGLEIAYDCSTILQTIIDNTNIKIIKFPMGNYYIGNPKDISNTWDLTYKIQNSIIYTSIKEGDIEIAYRAMRVDNEGYPLIPDDSSFIQALELYIKKKVFTILFDQGKINQAVLQNTQQEYAWAVGQARSSLSIPTIDQMESISNSWNTLVQRSAEHRRGFKTLGTKEYWRQH